MPKLTLAQYKEGLIEALARYGYTYHPPQCSLSWSNGWPYLRDETPSIVDCDGQKPYDVIIRERSIELFHGNAHAFSSHEHCQQFLQDMIPVLGKLDVWCEYDPGEKYKVGPRLRLYL